MRASTVSMPLLPPGEGRDDGIRDSLSCFPHPGPLPRGEGTHSGPTRAAASRGTTAVCQLVRQRGFSLIELIIVIVVIGAIGAIAGQVLFQVSAAYNQERDIGDADWQARVALERVARELRAVRTATAADLDITPATEIRFIDADGNGVCFRRNPGTNQLERSADGPATACATTATQPLADSISSLSFAYFQQDGVTVAAVESEVRYIAVSLTVSTGDYLATFRTLVKPRNF